MCSVGLQTSSPGPLSTLPRILHITLHYTPLPYCQLLHRFVTINGDGAGKGTVGPVGGVLKSYGTSASSVEDQRARSIALWAEQLQHINKNMAKKME